MHIKSFIRRRVSLRKILLLVVTSCSSLAVLSVVYGLKKSNIDIIQPPANHNRIAATAAHRLSDFKLWPSSGRLMTCELHGRIGNMMFAYASMVGISRRSLRSPVLPENHFLRALFHIRAGTLPGRALSITEYTEPAAGIYDRQSEGIASDSDLVKLTGYFQSWKYFRSAFSVIRAEFSFRREFSDKASKFLDRIVVQMGSGVRRRDVILVGIHVRVTDMASNRSLSRGYTVATPEYLSAAMDYFQKKFSTEKLLFVLATDDRDWCHDNFPFSEKYKVVNTIRDADIVDMAILAACNHTILTVGSFGWWAAWLAGGTTVYFRNFPHSDSSLAQEYKHEDYYPADWIPL